MDHEIECKVKVDGHDAALASEKVQAAIEGKTIRKVIVIKSRLVNIVAN